MIERLRERLHHPSELRHDCYLISSRLAVDMSEFTEIVVSRWIRGDGQQNRLIKDFLICAGAVTGALLALMLIVREPLRLDAYAAVASVSIFLAIAGIAIVNLDAHGHAKFGLANLITLARSALTSLIGGLVLTTLASAGPPGDEAMWLLAATVALALGLDGIDGYCARNSGTVSRFGARFDMEVDALLILFLSMAVSVLDKAGPWIILIGTMRYLFVAGQLMIVRLRGELPESRRRKAGCVMQGACLCVMLLPPVTSPYSDMIGFAALAVLLYSFTVDIIFLLRRQNFTVR
jgi:phosphatidylglycerophosphate synthase